MTRWLELEHSTCFDFEDGEGHLQLVDCLPNFRMLANFVLENFQQAVGSGDMFCRLAWIGAWLLVSPWALGIASTAARLNFMTVGALVLILALYEINDLRSGSAGSGAA